MVFISLLPQRKSNSKKEPKMNPEQYKAKREKLGLTQAGLAARLGVTRKTINSRETGATRITREAEYAILFLSNVKFTRGDEA